MSKILAKNVVTLINEKLVVNVTSCNLSINVVLTDTRTKSGRQVTGEYADWEISLTANYGVGMQSPSVTKGMVVPVEYRIGSMASYVGNARVSSYTANMPEQGEASYSMTLKGVSKLTKKVSATEV